MSGFLLLGEIKWKQKSVCLFNTTQLGAMLDTVVLQVAGLLTGKERIMVQLAEMLHKRLVSHFNLANLPLMNLHIKLPPYETSLRIDLLQPYFR